MIDNQTNIFEMLYSSYKITKPIRLIELFAGYGSQALALKYLGVEFEYWKICEWAIKSIQAYKDMHFTDVDVELNPDRTRQDMIKFLYQKGISNNYNDPMTLKQIERLSDKQLKTIIKNIAITNNLVNIQQVKGDDLCIKDTDKFTYLLTYSFPCQDLSLAGKGKGMSDTTTRSGMLWEVERILTECKEKPQILLMENVPQVHSQDNIEDFNKWQYSLEKMGYKNYWQDLIATDYGIPQTRNRCFMISILGDYNYTFPKPIPLKLKLKDMLEDKVDDKYYLSDKMIDYIYNDNTKNYNRKNARESVEKSIEKGIAATMTTNAGNRATDNYIKVNRLFGIYDKDNKKHQAGSVYDGNGLSPTIDTANGGYRMPCIQIKNATKKGYLEATEGDGIDISSRMHHHRGTVQKDKIQTITTMGGKDLGVIVNE